MRVRWRLGCWMTDRAYEELGNPAKCTENMNGRARKQSDLNYMKKTDQVEPINTLPLTKKPLSEQVLSERTQHFDFSKFKKGSVVHDNQQFKIADCFGNCLYESL